MNKIVIDNKEVEIKYTFELYYVSENTYELVLVNTDTSEERTIFKYSFSDKIIGKYGLVWFMEKIDLSELKDILYSLQFDQQILPTYTKLHTAIINLYLAYYCVNLEKIKNVTISENRNFKAYKNELKGNHIRMLFDKIRKGKETRKPIKSVSFHREIKATSSIHHVYWDTIDIIREGVSTWERVYENIVGENVENIHHSVEIKETNSDDENFINRNIETEYVVKQEDELVKYTELSLEDITEMIRLAETTEQLAIVSDYLAHIKVYITPDQYQFVKIPPKQSK